MGPESAGSAFGRAQEPRRALFRREEEGRGGGGGGGGGEAARGFQCFACKQEGHFARDCPLNANRRNPGGCDRREYPEQQCTCGRGPCAVRISNTRKNPQRHFYCCPAMFDEACGYFKWCDEVDNNRQLGSGSRVELNQQHWLDSPVKMQVGLKSPTKPYRQNGGAESSYPECACSAGKCRLLTVESGANAGHKYFGCTIKKGQGACNYFQWCDSPIEPAEKEICFEENKMSTPVKAMTGEETTNTGTGRRLVQKTLQSFFVANEPRRPEVDDVSCTPEQIQTSPMSPKRAHEPGKSGLCSPVKRLNLDGGSPGPSRPGNKGHWMKESAHHHPPPRTPCVKCGKFGHWASHCTS